MQIEPDFIALDFTPAPGPGAALLQMRHPARSRARCHMALGCGRLAARPWVPAWVGRAGGFGSAPRSCDQSWSHSRRSRCAREAPYNGPASEAARSGSLKTSAAPLLDSQHLLLPCGKLLTPFSHPSAPQLSGAACF